MVRFLGRGLRALMLLLMALPILAMLALASGVAWANSEGGRSMIERLAERYVPGLRIQGLSGSLPSRVTIARLAMTDEQGAWVEAEDVELAVSLLRLVRGEVRISELTARRVALHRLPPGGEAPPPDPDAPLIPALPQLPVSVRLDRLAVERLELGAPVMGVAAVLSAAGEATLESGRLAARLEVQRLDAPAQARLALDLAPGADRLSARLDLSEPAGGLLATALGVPGRASEAHVSLDGPASGARLELSAQVGEDIALTGQGEVSAAPDGAASARLEMRVSAGPLLPEDLRAAATPLDVALDAAMDAARQVTLRRLELRAPGGRARAQGSADLTAATLDLTAEVDAGASTAFGALVPPVARWESLRLTARASGAMAAPDVEADLAVQGFASDTPQLAAALGATPSLALRARLPERLESLTLRGAGLQVTAQGDVGETLDATIRAQVAELAPLVPGLAGSLRAEARITGPRGDPSLALTARGERIEREGQVLEALELSLRVATPLSAPRAEGTLRATYDGMPVSLDLGALPEGGKLRIERLAAVFGPARLSVQGLVDPAAMSFVGEANLAVPDLAPFSALAGTPLAGSVTLAATGALREGVQAIDATLEVPSASVGGTALGGRLTAQGTLADLAAVLEARALDARLTARARLTQQGAARQVEIAELLLRRGADSLRLAGPARVVLGEDGGIELSGIALTTSRGGTLRAEGRYGPETVDIRTTLAALPVAAIAALAAPGVAAEGVIGAEARITGPVAQPSARFRLEATGLRVADESLRGLPAARILVQGTAGAAAAEVTVEANAGAALRATGSVRLPRGFATDAPLDARVQANGDLGALAGPLLAAGAQRVTGRLSVDARAGGTLGAPELSGTASLANGSFRDLEQGVTLTAIAATLRAAGETVTIERFEARTPGNGTLSASGTVQPFAAGVPADITITARAARPVRSPLVTGVFDAELRLTGRLLEDGRAAGTIRIQRLDITVPEGLPPSVQVLDGVRERGARPAGTPALAPPAPPGAPSGLPPIALAITIEAPRAVFVRGRGIDAEFGGTIEIGGTIQAPLVSGGLRLRRGEISIFDRRLAFTRGNISFDAGTLVPSLDFVATARAREVTVNVNVTGPANDPRLEFTSTPELPQDEILSRLLFDRRASELSPFQLAQLAQVLAGAAGLETPGAGGILDRVRRFLALDRLAVGEQTNERTGRSEGATLETGRYVADGVYLGVRQGTDGGAPRVGVQIDVLPRVRVEAETGGGSAAGDRIGLSFEYEY